MVATSLYQIRVKDGKVLLRIASANTSENADLNQIESELYDLDVDFQPERLLEIYQKQSGQYEVLCDELNTEYQLQVEISKDEMKAYLTIIPPMHAGHDSLTMERINQVLLEAEIGQGIQYSILEKMIDDHIDNEPVLIALGQYPEDGSDGFLQLAVDPSNNTTNNPQPIDILELNLLKPVIEGQHLVSFVPPTEGKNGYTVTGRNLKARPGKKSQLYPGRNTRYDAERECIIATKAGHMCVKGKTVIVDKLYEVENVDSTTGNIRFDGILRVKGNIEDSFSVEVTTLIEVHGSVGKAKIKTLGDIRVEQGIIGGKFKVSGTIQAGYVSNAWLEAGENIVIREYILNSKVSAGKALCLLGKKGYISGGECHAGYLLKAPNAGSADKKIPTILDVGIPPEYRSDFHQFDQQFEKNFSNFETLKKNLLILQKKRGKQRLLSEAQETLFQKMQDGAIGTLITTVRNLREWNHMEETIRIGKEHQGGAVLITGEIQPGCVIKISRMIYNVNQPISNSAFVFLQDAVYSRPLDEFYSKFKKFLIPLENRFRPRSKTN
ncbi:FapA family protein [Deltaproteobacteria bacterium TL4]